MTGLASLGRVCLVDDHGEFRESAAWWLESLGYDVAAYDGPTAFLDSLGDGTGPERTCLLFDVRMPQMSGLELMDAVQARGIGHPVIFMTGHGDVPLAVEAMRKGAVTFLEKPFQEKALEEALSLAFSRDRPVVSAAPPAAAADSAAQGLYEARRARLTEREREVMDLVVAGQFNKVIAHMLGISPKTVELHRARIMTKMEAPTLTHLVRMAVSGQAEARA